MSFDSILQAIVDDCPGALGVALMGSDGIPIAQAAAPGGGGDPEIVNVLGVEFGRILDESRKAADAAEAGGALELAVRTERFHVVLQTLDPDTYLALALAPEGNVGKGRYLMRRHSLGLRELL
jgi:predicted regulator of Ras-like GTPase activity (Roadblock/LC7/MglB family)